MLGSDPQGHESPQGELYRIGEVSRLTGTKAFVLRYWETEFPMLQPVKTPKGHRLYRSEDVELVRAIKRLLYDEGFTIAGARRHLAGHGASSLPAEVHADRGNGHGNGHGSEQSPSEKNGHAENQLDETSAATRSTPAFLRELRTELAAILTLLGGR
jgi:DNA-binding transcriptional MerR regulator